MDNIPAPPKGKHTVSDALKYACRLCEIWVLIIYNQWHFLDSAFSIDTGLRNIIDKLAEFVARNGPEFETITKAKQQSNPRFSFLFGGEFYQYYQWRVSAEQAS